jgi:hypothetical protein
MDKNLRDLLYTLPLGANYADDLTELDASDIPLERIPKLLFLLKGDDSESAFRSAWILCCWGNEEGFEYMRSFVLRDPPVIEGWYPHRLHGYDDTYRFALDAFHGYWADRATKNPVLGGRLREKIFEPVLRIIELSNTMPFAIDSFFYLVEKEGFTEYLPALKAHLQAIIKEPDKHHWKVADCAHLLMKFDPEFVNQTLASHGYTLADFPNK